MIKILFITTWLTDPRLLLSIWEPTHIWFTGCHGSKAVKVLNAHIVYVIFTAEGVISTIYLE